MLRVLLVLEVLEIGEHLPDDGPSFLLRIAVRSINIFVLLVVVPHESSPHVILHFLADCRGCFLLLGERFIAVCNFDVGMTPCFLCFFGSAFGVLMVEQTVDQIDLVLVFFYLIKLVSCLAVFTSVYLVTEGKFLVQLWFETHLDPWLCFVHPVDFRAPKLALAELHGATHHLTFFLVLPICFKVGASTLQPLSYSPNPAFILGYFFVRIGAIMSFHHHLLLSPNVQILLLAEIDVEQVVDGCVFLRLA